MSKSTTTHKEEARGNVRFLIAMGIFGILVVMFAFILLSPDTHTKNAQLRQNDVVVRFYVLSSLPFNRNTKIIQGYWGRTTSNINWCERDYAVTFYIAEFWNTLTSLFMLFVGCVGMFATQSLPFRVGYLTLSMIGVGSSAFHATMRREEQMLDEVPMLFAVSAIMYLSLTARAAKRVISIEDNGVSLRKFGLIFFLVTFCVVITALMFMYPENPVIFLLSFGVALTLTVISGVMRYYHGGRSGRPVSRAQYAGEIALMIWGIGGIAWCIEPHVCHKVGPLQLHAWWHMASGVATHMTLQFYWYLELDFIVLASKKIHDKNMRIESETTCLFPFGVVVEE